MPTYEYECKGCSHTFEVFQSMSAAPLTSCPQCGKEVRRLINGGNGIIFKGSGFYVTDTKNKNSAITAPSSKGGSQTSQASPAPTSDSSTGSKSESAKPSSSSEKVAG